VCGCGFHGRGYWMGWGADMIDPICDDCYDEQKAIATKFLEKELETDRDDIIAEFAHWMLIMKAAVKTPGELIKYGVLYDGGPEVGIIVKE